MLIEHRGAVPEIVPAAYIAPTAVICGAVHVGPDDGHVADDRDGQ